MIRWLFGVCLVGISGILALVPDGTAQETKPSPQTKAPVRPKGLRVMFNGNSWFNFVPVGVAEQVKAAGIEGHVEVKPAKPNDLSLVEQGKVDVYAHGVHWWTEPIRDAEKLLTPALKANPDFRAYYHAAWLVGDGRAKEIKTRADYDDSKLADVQAALDKTRKSVEARADELNKKFGKPVVFIVPVGDAVMKLRSLIAGGKYLGVKKQSDLWTDAMPHAGAHVMALSGYCHFAAIYRTSPVGLKIARFKELTDEQHAILQKIAWETMSNYPYAGVAKQAPKTQGKTPTQRMEYFEVDGHKAFVILPAKTDAGKPIRWVGYTPCLLKSGLPGKSEDWMFERFLAAGIAVAGVDAGDCAGNPRSRELFTKLHADLVKNRKFSSKPALLARSRGGLFAFNWAVEHPDQVSCITGIYPVCNLKSYPGLGAAAKHYGLTAAELEKQLDKHNPVERLAPLAKAKVPLFAIHGDVDKVVPLEANSGAVEKRYRELGGSIRLIVPKGQGHNMWSGFFECKELVEFVIKHAK